MPTIRFSHQYIKMPADTGDTYLLEVLRTKRSDLHDIFVNYDTEYDKGWYELPDGELIVLLLLSYVPNASGGNDAILWTTTRTWSPGKEKYYRALRGFPVKIVSRR